MTDKEYLIKESTLHDIAESLREVSGTTGAINPSGMAKLIKASSEQAIDYDTLYELGKDKIYSTVEEEIISHTALDPNTLKKITINKIGHFADDENSIKDYLNDPKNNLLNYYINFTSPAFTGYKCDGWVAGTHIRINLRDEHPTTCECKVSGVGEDNLSTNMDNLQEKLQSFLYGLSNGAMGKAFKESGYKLFYSTNAPSAQISITPSFNLSIGRYCNGHDINGESFDNELVTAPIIDYKLTFEAPFIKDTNNGRKINKTIQGTMDYYNILQNQMSYNSLISTTIEPMRIIDQILQYFSQSYVALESYYSNIQTYQLSNPYVMGFTNDNVEIMLSYDYTIRVTTTNTSAMTIDLTDAIITNKQFYMSNEWMQTNIDLSFPAQISCGREADIRVAKEISLPFDNCQIIDYSNRQVKLLETGKDQVMTDGNINSPYLFAGKLTAINFDELKNNNNVKGLDTNYFIIPFDNVETSTDIFISENINYFNFKYDKLI